MTDTELMNAFFATWRETDAAARATALEACITDAATYSDPNCPAPMEGTSAINQMLGMFSANMPGGSAWVLGEAEGKNGFMRAQVAFGMNGKEMMQGQYFARRDDDKLSMIVGFIGGKP